MKQRICVIVCSMAIFLSLLACKWLDLTTVRPDGSGEYREEIGYNPEELNKENPKTFCQPGDNPKIRITKERRGEDTWCVATQTFANMRELRAIYGGIKLDSTNTVTVNQVEMKDRTVYYDINVDWTSLPTTVVDIQWRVSLPGKVVDSNADKVEGNALLWSFREKRIRNLRAVSSLFVILPPITIRLDR